MIKNSAKTAPLFAEALSVLYFALIVAIANIAALPLIIFPEMGAVSSDVLLRPNGKWAKEPWKLVCTPTLAATVGVLISSHFAYGVVTVLVAMTLCIGIVFALRSAVAPAISAGVLPIVLGVTSWLYPVSVLASLVLLVVILLVWKRTALGKILGPIQTADQRAIEILESSPKGGMWFGALFAFVAVMGGIAQLSTWRFILFPPLIVMAYEMLGHPKTHPWAKHPFTLPAVCTGSALVGVEAVRFFGVTPQAAVVSMVFTFILLRVSRMRMPPAVAIGLIPLVIPSPTLKYPLSVAIGTSALTLWSLGSRWLATRSRALGS